jgi:SAM-dependent methyltransferase
MQPHSRAWYTSMTTDYTHPWRQNLLEVSGEVFYDALLEKHFNANTSVLEAGCAGGRDAALYAPKVKYWAGFDFIPHFLETARAKIIPNTSFINWHSSKENIPNQILELAPFDLIVARRGPSSIVQHLPNLVRAEAKFIAVAAGDATLLEQYNRKLEAVQWQVTWSAVVKAQGFLPTFEDYALQREYNALPFSRADWNANYSPLGLPFLESRVVLVAQAI